MDDLTPRTTVQSTDTSTARRVDDLFEVFANARRRHVLGALQRTSATTVDAVVTELAGRDDAPPAESLAVSLQYHHLPRLADANLIRYDRDAGAIALVTQPTGSLGEALLLAAADEGGAF